jgi:hypothetical protein
MRYQKLQQQQQTAGNNNKQSTRLTQTALEYLNSLLLEENLRSAGAGAGAGPGDDETRRSSTASDTDNFRSLNSFALPTHNPSHHYRPSQQQAGENENGRTISTMEDGRLTRASVDSLLPDYGHQSIVIRSELYDEMIPNSFKFFKKTIFFPEFILASSVHHLLVMLTFGLMSPVLMIVVALLTTVTSLLWEVLIGRWLIRDENYLGDENDKKFSGPYTTKLDELCIHVCRSPRKCVFLLSYGTAVFYALLLLDIAGDKDGWYDSLWAPITIMAVATALFAYFNYFFNVYATLFPAGGTGRGSSGSDRNDHEDEDEDGEQGRDGGESIMILNPIHKMMIMARLDRDHDESPPHRDDPGEGGGGGGSGKLKKKTKKLTRLELRSQRLTLEQIRSYQQHQQQLQRIQQRQHQQLLLQQQQQSPLTTLKKTLFPSSSSTSSSSSQQQQQEKDKEREREREREREGSRERGHDRPAAAGRKDSMIELASIYPAKNEI